MWLTRPGHHAALRRPWDAALTSVAAFLFCLCVSPAAQAGGLPDSRASSDRPSNVERPQFGRPFASTLDRLDSPVPHVVMALDDDGDAPDATSDDGAGDVVVEVVRQLTPPSGVCHLSIHVARLSNLISHEPPALRGPPESLH